MGLGADQVRVWWWIEPQRTWVHVDPVSQEVADTIVAKLTGAPLFEIVVVSPPGSDMPPEPTIQQRNISANKQFFASANSGQLLGDLVDGFANHLPDGSFEPAMRGELGEYKRGYYTAVHRLRAAIARAGTSSGGDDGRVR